MSLRVADGDPVGAAVDRTMVQRALGNLISNALRHTPAGGQVVLSATHRQDAVVIEISDTGRGIPPEHLSRVSDRFYRVDASRTSRSGGLGLGLAIVESIMKVHGGSMEILSPPGSGTTVSLIFPNASARPPLEARQDTPAVA